MKIIVDDKIPYIQGQIERLAEEVVYLPGARIGAKDVRDADVLIVRTRTRCDRALLEGSRVKFVATATIGYDHLDTAFLDEAHIGWTNCPGCNATSVAQYVHSSLLLLEREKGMQLRNCTLGIVGVGNVGTAVYERCRSLMGRILLNDPPRQEREKNAECRMQNAECGMQNIECGTQSAGFSFDYCSLEEIMQKCDIITIHTPLVEDGEHPTFHLFDDTVLHGLSHRPVLINCGRGEVVDNEALEKALDEGRVREAIIDVWENEPHIRRSLLNKVYIGTPHVAGYSADGKANATRMSLEAVARWMGRETDFSSVRPPRLPEGTITACEADEIALQLYNPKTDSERLKSHSEDFETLRGNYPLRREFLD